MYKWIPINALTKQRSLGEAISFQAAIAMISKMKSEYKQANKLKAETPSSASASQAKLATPSLTQGDVDPAPSAPTAAAATVAAATAATNAFSVPSVDSVGVPGTAGTAGLLCVPSSDIVSVASINTRICKYLCFLKHNPAIITMLKGRLEAFMYEMTQFNRTVHESISPDSLGSLRFDASKNAKVTLLGLAINIYICWKIYCFTFD